MEMGEVLSVLTIRLTELREVPLRTLGSLSLPLHAEDDRLVLTISLKT